MKVLLSGEGADEVFLGYKWFENFSNYSEFLEYIPFDIAKGIFKTQNSKNPNFDKLSLVEAFQKIYLGPKSATGLSGKMGRMPTVSTFKGNGSPKKR